MVENHEKRVTIQFECPVCNRAVEMLATSQHNLTHDTGNHQPTFGGKPKADCPVSFGKDDRKVRQCYDFIHYEIPVIFMRLPEQVTDEEVLSDAITGAVEQSLGIRIAVGLRDREGNREGQGSVYAWYHSNKPSYYGVTTGITTPQNVIVTGSREEFGEFLEKWYYWNREPQNPNVDYGTDEDDDEQEQTLDDF